jgi:thioredoxin 2
MGDRINIPCGQCGALNRVEIAKANLGPKCARCKAALDLAHPVNVTADQFDKVVSESAIPVLVDFWAPWCGPCRSMAPVLEDVAKRRMGRVLVAKLNTDDHPTISSRYGIQGVPTLIMFNGGREVSRQVGAVPRETLENMIDREYN